MTARFLPVSEIAKCFAVDERTLKKAMRKAGLRVIYFGRSPRVSREDFETMKREGLPYNRDRIKPIKP